MKRKFTDTQVVVGGCIGLMVTMLATSLIGGHWDLRKVAVAAPVSPTAVRASEFDDSSAAMERPYGLDDCPTIDYGPNLPAEFLTRSAEAADALEVLRESREFWIEFLGDRSKSFEHSAQAIRDGIDAGYYEGEALTAALCDIAVLESKVTLYEGRIELLQNCDGTVAAALAAIDCLPAPPPEDESEAMDWGSTSDVVSDLRRR